jgi:hypothetical protein
MSLLVPIIKAKGILCLSRSRREKKQKIANNYSWTSDFFLAWQKQKTIGNKHTHIHTPHF